MHLGLSIPTGEKVAIKVISKQRLNSRDLGRVQREISILKMVLHPGIVQLLEIIETEKSLLLVMEYLQGGELFDHIVSQKK